MFATKDTTNRTSSKVNPFRLTKRQDQIAKTIADNVSCTVDKKNYVISISVEAQDPLICATLTDTVQNRLQQFITDYRTSKARKDLEYYQNSALKQKANMKGLDRHMVAMLMPTMTSYWNLIN